MSDETDKFDGLVEADFEPGGMFYETPDGAWDDVDEAPPKVTLDQLPKAKKQPVRHLLQSADPDLRICVHELARALEEYATKEPVPLYGGMAEFETAAINLVELMRGTRCTLKGA